MHKILLLANLLLAFTIQAQPLTPFGANQLGNNGAIPEWVDNHNIVLNDEILFTIDASNYQQYEDNLTAGQITLFKNYPETFKMNIYKTQRTAVAPKWVYDNNQYNKSNTTLNQDQSGFENSKGGIPFIEPESALEVYFNHISRWRGLQIKNTASDAVVYKNGKYKTTTRKSIVRFDHYIPNKESKNFISVISKTIAPSTLSGSGVLVLEPLDQLNKARSSWIWDKGRRRVIRAPNVAYDQPISDAGSLRTADDTDMINGSPDRFEWELLGKKELYIPYNNEKLASKDLKYKQILTKNHINPEHTRYELHRVWMIRANLKPKWRHIYSKREFYLDEDSWQVVIADQYNKRGDLWRSNMSYTKFYHELPGVLSVVNVFHDLISQDYHVMGLQNEEQNTNQFDAELAKDSTFTPNGFKRFMK